ncbi:MAG TPA: AarF/UbiB family protein [Gemmatimonadales bacterium]
MHTLHVFFSLVPFAMSFLRDRRRWIWWGAPMVRSPEDHEHRAQRLVATIVRLGPTFVKMAQVFASRADIIPEPYLSQLGTLTDQVPPMPFADVERTVRESYDRGVDEVFQDFEREPVAAASLGQVHRARYQGQLVAVKVLRPNVERAVASDLKAGRRILSWVRRWWNHPEITRIGIVLEEFSVRIGEEMDFRLEGEYCTEIGANFANNNLVIIPKVVPELTRQRVLVEEFIEGVRIDRLKPEQVNVRRIVQTLIELYVQMMFIDGLFHADPHAGNLMLAPDGRIVLVDFGMVVRVELDTRRRLIRMVSAAVERDIDATTQGFWDLGCVLPEADPKQIRWLAELLIANAYSRTTTKERIDQLIADNVMKTLFDFPVILPHHLVYFARAATLIEGIGTRYDPYFQALPVASPVFLRMRSRMLRSLGEPLEPSMTEIATVAGYALGKALEWAKNVWGNAEARP